MLPYKKNDQLWIREAFSYYSITFVEKLSEQQFLCTYTHIDDTEIFSVQDISSIARPEEVAEHLERQDKKRKEELIYFQRSTGLSFKDIVRLATELDTPTQEKEM